MDIAARSFTAASTGIDCCVLPVEDTFMSDAQCTLATQDHGVCSAFSCIDVADLSAAYADHCYDVAWTTKSGFAIDC